MRADTIVGAADRGERAARAISPSTEEMSRREQRALTLSLWGVALVAVGSTAYGLYLESDVVVGPHFALQTMPQQDRLRERIWAATGLPLDRAWVSICLTADPRWV